MSFYDNLMTACEKRGVKITPTVLQCGGTKGIISGWKRGIYPNSEIVIRLSVLLNVPTDFLLLGNDANLPAGIDTNKQKLLDLYTELSETNRIKVLERAQTLYDLEKQTETAPISDTDKPTAAILDQKKHLA